MYQHPLERVLLYTDKNSLEDFKLSQTEYDELYELYITTKGDVLESRISAAEFFNEVFYYLTSIYDDNESSEHLMDYYEAQTALYPPVAKYQNPKNDVDRVHGYEYLKNADEAKYYIMDFVWFILNKQQELPHHVVFFLKALNKQHNKDKTHIADEFRAFLKDHPDKNFNISFTSHPEFGIDLIMSSGAEWQDATLDFDRAEILKIVSRFSGKDQQQIISLIKEAYMIRKGEGIERQISKVTYGKRANETFLDNLAKEENLQMLNSITSTSETLPQEPAPDSGFAGYIIKEHDKVLNILMLVANMGKNQMPLLIKFIRAFQKLGYIRKDCLDHQEEFILKASAQFENTCFDKTNVKRQIEIGERLSDTDYHSKLEDIVKYLDAVMRS